MLHLLQSSVCAAQNPLVAFSKNVLIQSRPHYQEKYPCFRISRHAPLLVSLVSNGKTLCFTQKQKKIYEAIGKTKEE